MFNLELAEKRFKELLRLYRIKVWKWSKSSCGKAWWQLNKIQVPHIKDTDTFCVCMHEIKHIIDGGRGLRLTREFDADYFAYEEAQALGFDTADWVRRMNWHTLSRIAMAHNRRLKHDKIPDRVREWFKDVDFAAWNGQNVFVRHSKTEPKGYTIEMRPKVTAAGIRMLLGRDGLMLEQSDIDDSTYGHWIVKANGERYGSEFVDLYAIVDHYKLDPLLADI